MLAGLLWALAHLPAVRGAGADGDFVRISPRDPRYLELSDGQPYIPIGLNLANVPKASLSNEAASWREMDEWFRKLADNGGNYARIWLGTGFWDVEREHSGVYDETRARRIAALLDLARRHGIRLKLCLEHFRSLDPDYPQTWGQKLIHRVDRGGPATSMNDFFTGERSREQFKRKLGWLAQHIGNDPAVFGWELWNEINAVNAKEDAYRTWTEEMLGELHRLSPKNLAMQSLGSFDRTNSRPVYQRFSRLPGNDLAQVHRYLDLGAPMAVCHGPVDVLAADAVRELLAFQPHRPVMLAESGAVEPSHTGPFKLYPDDHAGIILHDVLFAPFFAGAAGPGHCWHWDDYVDRNNLWHHLARLAAVVKDIDPPAEHFQPSTPAHPQLHVYQLQGRHTLLLWCRDPQNTWENELQHGQPPKLLAGLTLDVASALRGQKTAAVKTYDPWKNEWQKGDLKDGRLALPPFSRSVVVRITLKNQSQ